MNYIKNNRLACWKLTIHQVALMFVVGLLLGCSEQNRYIEPPPPSVTVSKPVRQKVTEYLEFTGTTSSVGFVEVRARVAGELQSMHFEPGAFIAKDDLLFIIDPQPYQADLDAALADLASAKAEYHRTEVELEQADQLFKKNYMSETDHLRKKTDRDVAKANIGRMQAKVENARIKLGYTRVTAPIAGRVGRNMVDIGNLVGDGETTLLTTVTQYDPIYAYFHLNERDLLRIMAVQRKQLEQSPPDSRDMPTSALKIPVYLGLSDETGYPHRGILDFGASGVNTDTGTIELRAVFPNTEGPVVQMVPGLFVRLRFPVGTDSKALLVSERAFAVDQEGEYVLVANSENVVEKRPVVSGQVVDGMKVIKKGITADDRIIINGLQRARPGGKVNPQLEQQAPAAADKG